MNELAKTMVMAGLALAGLGALLWAGAGKWFGKLPGDIHITRENFSFHFPIVTCLVLSGILSLILWLVRK